MSNLERFENIKQIIKMVEPQFADLARIHNAVNYKREASFALQILQDNDYLAQIAMSNQDSLKRAVINVAAIGLSLNPFEKLAYLVPRKSKVCLDLSYLGLIKLATDIGSIKWAASEIVREKDDFTVTGVNTKPDHQFKPFEERGKIVGAYCVAKTNNDEFIVTHMTIDEIYSIRNRSESFKSGKASPWTTDESEMIKKTVIRRAYKSWPRTDTRDRLDQAIDVTNEVDPLDFSTVPALESSRVKNLELIREHLKTLGRTEEKYLEHMARVVRRDLKKLDDMTEIEINQGLVMLNQWVEADKAKKAKEANENPKAD